MSSKCTTGSCGGATSCTPADATDYYIDQQVVNTQYQNDTIKRYLYPPTGVPLWNKTRAPAWFHRDPWQHAAFDFESIVLKMVLWMRQAPRNQWIHIRYNDSVQYTVRYVCDVNKYRTVVRGPTVAQYDMMVDLPEELFKVLVALLLMTLVTRQAPAQFIGTHALSRHHYTETGITWDAKLQSACQTPTRHPKAVTQWDDMRWIMPQSDTTLNDAMNNINQPHVQFDWMATENTTGLWFRTSPTVVHTVHSSDINAPMLSLSNYILALTHDYRYYPVTPREQHIKVPSFINTPDLHHNPILG